MIVQIDIESNYAVVSGHFFRNYCPARVSHVCIMGLKGSKPDDIIESGHRIYSIDTETVRGLSGHPSGQVVGVSKRNT